MCNYLSFITLIVVRRFDCKHTTRYSTFYNTVYHITNVLCNILTYLLQILKRTSVVYTVIINLYTDEGRIENEAEFRGQRHQFMVTRFVKSTFFFSTTVLILKLIRFCYNSKLFVTTNNVKLNCNISHVYLTEMNRIKLRIKLNFAFFI